MHLGYVVLVDRVMFFLPERLDAPSAVLLAILAVGFELLHALEEVLGLDEVVIYLLDDELVVLIVVRVCGLDGEQQVAGRRPAVVRSACEDVVLGLLEVVAHRRALLYFLCFLTLRGLPAASNCSRRRSSERPTVSSTKPSSTLTLELVMYKGPAAL